MLRCECRARLGRGWNFCETCGRPVPVDSGLVAPAPEVVTAPEGTPPMVESVQPVLAATTQMAQGLESVTPVPPKAPALLLSRADWRFALLPLMLGWVLGLPLLGLSLWCAPVGLVLGGFWAWRQLRRIRQSLDAFSLEWIFDKVEVYGPCALGAWAWWPTGVLYLTDQTLKFKPFGHSQECEVSLDPARITGVDFPTHFSWPADWAGMLVSSSYGPVFGTMKVFDRILWGQILQAARDKSTGSPVWEQR